MRSKSDLPAKICATCGRPFTWRRKWARDWAAVIYCSRRCSGSRRKSQRDTDTTTALTT